MMYVRLEQGRVWHILPPPALIAEEAMCGEEVGFFGPIYCKPADLPDAAALCSKCLRKAQEMLDELGPELEKRKGVTG